MKIPNKNALNQGKRGSKSNEDAGTPNPAQTKKFMSKLCKFKKKGVRKKTIARTRGSSFFLTRGIERIIETPIK
jgi:hypothetical protein